jgi:hypothetical protein
MLRELTPTPTVADSNFGSSARSEVDSTTATQRKKHRRTKTQERRAYIPPETELSESGYFMNVNWILTNLFSCLRRSYCRVEIPSVCEL